MVRVFSFKGKTLEQLEEMTSEEFAKLINSRERRTLLRGLNDRQKKLLEKYKSELERISLLDIARTQFETDVQRRKGKIEKFKKKYGITVQPRNTLEEVIRSLELKKKKED